MDALIPLGKGHFLRGHPVRCVLLSEFPDDLCLVQADGEDELKKMQLMELAIMNGTYRDAVPPQPGTTFIVNTPR